MKKLTLFVIAIAAMVIIVLGLLSVTSCAQTTCLISSNGGQELSAVKLPVIHFGKKLLKVTAKTPVFVVSNICTDRPLWDIELNRLGSKNTRIHLRYVRANDKTSYWPTKPLSHGKYILGMGDADEMVVYFFKH